MYNTSVFFIGSSVPLSKNAHNLSLIHIYHRPLLDIYHSVDALPGIKKSFIGSGVRYDLLQYQSKDPAVNRSEEHTSELQSPEAISYASCWEDGSSMGIIANFP